MATLRTLAYLEHFAATRREVLDLSLANLGHACSDLPGYVYADRFFIEIEEFGGYFLPIANQQHRSDDLAELEGLLFEYAQHEGLDAEECHASCMKNSLPCPKVCPVCGGAS